MSAIALTSNDFSLNQEEIHLLASIRYWALISEANQSDSYSKIRKHFVSDDGKAAMRGKYRQSKIHWIDHWYYEASRLLDIGDKIPWADLHKRIDDCRLSRAKAMAICVELAVFNPYYNFSSDSTEGDGLSFDDDDQKCYLGFCAQAMQVDRFKLESSIKHFKHAALLISKEISGPDYSVALAALAALAMAVLAHKIGGAVGGLSGLRGAAARNAGLALLGGGSLAAGGLGMTGGLITLMACGGILAYTTGNLIYKKSLQECSKEELVFNLSKLYSVVKGLMLANTVNQEICHQMIHMQADLEKHSDTFFLQGEIQEGKNADVKSQVLRAFRRLLRGDLQ